MLDWFFIITEALQGRVLKKMKINALDAKYFFNRLIYFV